MAIKRESRVKGFENIVLSKINIATDGTVTYEAPTPIPGAISLELKPNTSSDKLYSDDTLEDVINTFDSIDVKLEINAMDVKNRALIQGAKVSSGVLIESKNDIAPDFAMAFKAPKVNGKFMYVWVLRGKFLIPTESFETEADKVKAQTLTYEGTFSSREDGYVKLTVHEDANVDSKEEAEHKAIIAAWFDGVPTIATDGTLTPATKPGTGVLGTLTVTSAEGAATGETKITVSPAKESGNSYKYKTAASITMPAYDESAATGYTAWDGSADIAATSGNKILIVEVDSTDKIKKAGEATVVSKA